MPNYSNGSGSAKALYATIDGDRLIIRVGLYGPDDGITPAMTGDLTILRTNEGHKYLSYTVVRRDI